MKLKTLTLAARLGSCALLAALPLHAAATDYAVASAGFIGAGVGSNSLDGDDYTGNGDRVDDRQMAYKGLAGYRLNRNVSLEGQYIDFGTAEEGGNRVKAHGVTAGGVFEARMGRLVHPYAKAGALFWDADGEFNDVKRSDTGVDFTYGAGLRFILGPRVDIRTEYERFEFQQSNVQTLSATLQFNF